MAGNTTAAVSWPFTVSVDGAATQLADHYLCIVCLRRFEDYAQADGCCASAKRARQARADRLLALLERKEREIERIEEQLRVLGVTL